MQFEKFPKLARLSRDIVITEKIDGTNAQIVLVHHDELPAGFSSEKVVASHGGYYIFAGSRKRYVIPGDDNFGFAKWVLEHAEELTELGPGQHFGEWWGQGIQRNYGLDHKRFSLFNTHRWCWHPDLPACCDVVPVIYQGPFDMGEVFSSLHVLTAGSYAAPGFMDPEGIVIYHTAANMCFKKTMKNDDKPKSVGSARA